MKSKIAVVALLLLPKAQANYGLAMRSHDKSKCLERGGFDNDCCSRKEEASCKDRYKLTWGPTCYSTWAFSYACTAPAASRHDKSKCRENGGFDNDCCAIKGTESCADGFAKKMSDNVCYDGGSWRAHSYECFPASASANFHDKSKCLENGRFDNDCCAIKGTAKCKDGHYLTWGKGCVAGNWAHSYTCTPGDGGGGGEAAYADVSGIHDPSKCRENGRFDNDCCAVRGTESCADKFTKIDTGRVCYEGGSWRAHNYECRNGDVPYPVDHDAFKCEAKTGDDCCAVKAGTVSFCSDQYETKWLGNKPCLPGSKDTRYSCLPPLHDASKCASDINGKRIQNCCATLGTGACRDGYTFTRGNGCPGVGKYSFFCTHPDRVTDMPSAGAPWGVILPILFLGVLGAFGYKKWKEANAANKLANQERLAVAELELQAEREKLEASRAQLQAAQAQLPMMAPQMQMQTNQQTTHTVVNNYQTVMAPAVQMQ